MHDDGAKHKKFGGRNTHHPGTHPNLKGSWLRNAIGGSGGDGFDIDDGRRRGHC